MGGRQEARKQTNKKDNVSEIIKPWPAFKLWTHLSAKEPKEARAREVEGVGHEQVGQPQRPPTLSPSLQPAS